MKSAEGWSVPENIHIPYFLNKSPATQRISIHDGRSVCLRCGCLRITGVEDLYVSLLREGKWSEPRNLGRRSIQLFRKQAPAECDGRYLFFASNGRKGYGSYDVYFAERLDDSWLNWTDPVNMGANINSEGRELFYMTYPEQKFALFYQYA